ncbi:MAG TPA: endonuclease/exonuclease/phosphatase family protein [Burkholderiales bacterium]|nr:endonuclease/exonuclease/phosphatase family protein [Burkholderiales bacterium]
MRLLCWNIQWCRGLDGVVDPARIAAEARRVDADLICLQEVAANFPDLAGSRGEDQPHILMHALPEYEGCLVSGVDLPAANGRRSRFGNVILSRFKVGRVLRHSLPWPAADVPTMPRAAVEAVIEAPFGPLRIITTHLEYFSGEHRAAQVERLRDVLGEGSERGEADGAFRAMPWSRSAIVCGDFNLPPHDPLHARMTESLVDAWQALHPGVPHPPTFRVHEREQGESPYCCDYVFVTGDLVPRLRSIRVDAENRASDHQPVILELA